MSMTFGPTDWSRREFTVQTDHTTNYRIFASSPVAAVRQLRKFGKMRPVTDVWDHETGRHYNASGKEKRR